MRTRHFQYAPALAAWLVLGGCSPTPAGTEGAADVSSPSASLSTPGTVSSTPNTASEEPELPVILAFGDSLTAGLGIDRSRAYPSQLQGLLDQAGYHYQVVNDGEDGLTTSGGLARLDRALALDPQIVILELGGNDGLRGTPLSVVRDNLRTLAGSFQASGARVILAGMTLPRNYGPDYIRDFENIYVEIADELDVDLMPFFLDGVVDLENPLESIGQYMQPDGTHPTAEGHAIIAGSVFRAIDRYLGP